MKKKQHAGNTPKNVVETPKTNETPTYHSPRNGEVVGGKIYNRKFDFNRDSWYNLVDKLTSPKWMQGDYLMYRPAISMKLEERILKGSCTRKQVVELMKLRAKKIESKIASLDFEIKSFEEKEKCKPQVTPKKDVVAKETTSKKAEVNSDSKMPITVKKSKNVKITINNFNINWN